MGFFFFKRFSEEDKKLLKNLKLILDFKPKNLELYKVVFTHASVGRNTKNNERLEFVGDSVMGLIITDILYNKFPKADEGRLSILRASIVSRQSLNVLGENLGLDQLVDYKNTSGNEIKNLSGNALEAMVGAIYFDRGYHSAKKFVEKLVYENFDLEKLLEQNKDYKSKLLQLIQKFKLNITFNTYENMESNEKNQHFLCELCLDDKFLAEGKAWTKKEAEQKASKQALQKLSHLRLN